MESTLKIRNVEVEGFGNLGHVIMRELGDRIVLEGVNGVGKTMILTAIRAALEGKTGLPDRPLAEWVKDGHESAVIKLDLADGTAVRFSIRVVITADDFDLQIKEVFEDGKAKKISGGPMTFLKTIVNAIAFRPQQWRKKSDAEQCEEVFNFFPGLKEKLSRNDRELSETERQRAEMLGRSKVLRLDIERAPFISGLPEKEIDPADLMNRLSEAERHNLSEVSIENNIASATRDITVRNEMIDNERKSIEHYRKEIERSEERLKQLVDENEKSKAVLAEKQGERDSFVPVDVESIRKEIYELKVKNESIRRNADRKKMQLELDETELRAQELYRKVVAVKKARTEIMGSAEIPIDGLSIGDGCLLYPNSNMDMVRLSALSDGEFWPVACGLVASFNPRVRIVIVDNLHDLDKGNFDALCAAAVRYGMQIWIHKTLWDESDAGAGFLIRGGEVVQGPKGEQMEKEKINLCDTCEYELVVCPARNEDVRFGDGVGNDNVIECKHFKSSDTAA